MANVLQGIPVTLAGIVNHERLAIQRLALPARIGKGLLGGYCQDVSLCFVPLSLLKVTPAESSIRVQVVRVQSKRSLAARVALRLLALLPNQGTAQTHP